ncbi:hypothetical protein P885DRAFT_67766 [Corynascus similis CBS 632.67]
MKTFIPVLALAAGVSATFIKAPPFTCPANTDNQCTDKQKPGFSWDDLDFGDFFDYGDFTFRGWKCEDGGEKRGRFAPRTFKKVIGGTCHSEKSKSPSFGCGPKVDKFSLGSIHVRPEFDCDLEFHYDMPDGSLCKHRSRCSKSGTTVRNTQCGGAKNVTIVFPPQPNLPKPSCSIQVPTISFDCSTASSTQPPKTKTTETPATSSPPAEATTTSEVEASSTTSAESSTSSDESSNPPAETSSEVVPGSSTTDTPPEATSTTSVSPGQETSESSVDVPPPVTKTITTSFDSTSTVFTTSTQTIISCPPEKSEECPGNSVVTTVVTIPVSTTVCPITETRTTVENPSTTTDASPSDSPSDNPSDGPSGTSTVAPGSGSSSSSSSAVSSLAPVETLPCPAIVPSCLNTFIFSLGCSDNTDTACYCPDATFVKNVYDCLYAHGENDAIVAEAIAYFQGICGSWAGQNPAIATGATITTYITVTATPTVAPIYTTVTVDVTTVVPCTDEAGEVIPSSSTTVTVSTSLTVPQVGFTTGSSSDVDVIPVTEAPPTVTTSLSPGAGDSEVPGSGVVTATGTDTSVATPTGTGSFRPTTSIVFAGSGRVTGSFGLAAAVAALAVAF